MAQLLVLICPGTSRTLPLVAILWSGASWETQNLVLCDGRRCQRETTHCPYLLVGFCLVFSFNDHSKIILSWFSLPYTSILQEISKQVVGIHLISMAAQNMDTGYWRYRLDTQKSSVSVITDWWVVLEICVHVLLYLITPGNKFSFNS